MKLLRKLILFFLSIGIALGFCEFSVRKFFDFSQIVRVEFKGNLMNDRKDYFELSEDNVLLYEWRHPSQKLFKDKKENTFRIIAIGDSITCRAMWTIDDYYPKLLEDLLNRNLPDQNYEVINAGVPGYNTIQEERYLREKWLSYVPDLVILGYCVGNDRAIQRKIVKFKDGLYCSDTTERYPYILNLPFNNFFLANSAFYRFINIVCINIFNLDKMQPCRIKYFDLSYKTQKAIKRIKEMSIKKDFKLVFVIFPKLENCLQPESNWIVNKCKEYGIEYIDLRNRFGKAGYENIRISNDDFYHPNKLGQQLATEEIFEYFKKTKK